MKDFKFYLNQQGEVGFVQSVAKSIVWVDGLPKARPKELVLFETGQVGQILFLHQDEVEILLLSQTPVSCGTRVVRTGEKFTVRVGPQFLGQVIDSLGEPVFFDRPFPLPKTAFPIDQPSPGISQRATVRLPLETGVAILDMLVPLGRGQRELILGDRKTGKTAVLVQTVLHQAKKGTVCIWGAIGKKRAEIKQIKEFFHQQQVLDKIVIVASSCQDSAALIYLTPYTALALAQYFCNQGENVLVVLDDMTTHAKFCREIALLARRFPGRDSYPVDIFFTHAQIMEKGGNFKNGNDDVSITILPVAETVSGDLSGYIQTNLMSMTDGHIFFDKDFFSWGRRPAINPFLSVTRVGHQCQTPLRRQVSRQVLAFLALWEKLGSFVTFGAELTGEVKESLAKGERIINFFNQGRDILIPPNVSVFLLGVLWLNLWKDKDPQWIKETIEEISNKYEKEKDFRKKIDSLVEGCLGFSDLLEKTKNKEKTIFEKVI